jgi:hypothetical protein
MLRGVAAAMQISAARLATITCFLVDINDSPSAGSCGSTYRISVVIFPCRHRAMLLIAPSRVFA